MDNEVASTLSEEEIIPTLKVLVQDHEVHNIVGEDGAGIKQIRDATGATISICDGSCLDRIILITGSISEVCEACKLIFDRLGPYFDDDMDQQEDPDSLVVKLVIPASQCGSLIGKGGSRIKEIRDITGAMMQVLPEMLPNSNERTIQITGGSLDSIVDCVYEICCALDATPPKYSTIQYKPNNDMVEGPVIFAEGKAYSLQGDAAVPIADANYLLKNDLLQPFLGITNNADGAIVTRMLRSVMQDKEMLPNDKKQNFQMAEMRVPDSCAGGIVGKNGIRLTEIRQISGAIIIVSNLNDSSDIKERLVTIKGTRESIALAKFLINVSIELQKTNYENAEPFEPLEVDPSTATLQNILSRPGALNIVANIAGYQNIPEFLTTFDPALRYMIIKNLPMKWFDHEVVSTCG